MSETITLTDAQTMVEWPSVQRTEGDDRFIEGVWAIFGNGAGVGDALHGIGDGGAGASRRGAPPP